MVWKVKREVAFGSRGMVWEREMRRADIIVC
jgi:hypothetical protein